MKKPISRFEVFPRIEGLLDVDMVPRRIAEPREESVFSASDQIRCRKYPSLKYISIR
ncbi:MAG TPA: hypothetical protein VMV48_02940 [Gallionellaceae bacterium]|nr:hypothetical protein [Gallionellaceae bacterium]